MIHKFLEDIREKAREGIENAIESGNSHVSVSYDTESLGFIDVCIEKNGAVSVYVVHDDERERRHPRIIEAVIEVVPDWRDIEMEMSDYDEWNEHGFRDAADYYRWRYGR